MASAENLPTLKLVPVEDIRFHEHPERKRTLKLVERLRNEKILRNPPIVAAVPNEKYVLLDGANRVSAFAELGYSHVPVQVIDYGSDTIQLKGWHHLLVGSSHLRLRHAYAKLDLVDLAEVEPAHLGELLELRQLYAALVDDQSQYWGLFPKQGAEPFRRQTWMAVLEAVIEAYEGKTQLERIKLADYDNLPSAFQTVNYQLVLYPTLMKFELLELVREGVMIPTGITRHLIPGRALGLNLELEFLTAMKSDEEKIQHFAGFVRNIEVEGRIRFYEESLFIMNE